ncbi:hypothetical protein SAMN05421644_1076 [Allochromatium warmingii]|uniref:HNH nuclease domain-containing protein n=1 Tax=Allochromatium warmingii TaxID=61595 RepID=A0A1H3CTN7_ALLWA|nr:HNH endonuclease signature motif containing protein [Allochromatium warmingii]SDX57475.1 hypothetical protein SAMN05421644_1076 [Allochromatium warmingii]
MEHSFLIIIIEVTILISGFVGLWFYKNQFALKNKKNSEFYSDYLNSKKWEDLRRKALERSDYKCEFCSSPYKAVHHVRYPKKYKEDHLDNLLVVCDKCHAKLHGIRDEKMIEKNEKIVVNESENLYSEEVKTGSHIYYFHVRYFAEQKKCLRIIESGKRGERQVEVTEDDLEKFAQNITEGLALLNNKGYVQFEEKILANNCTYFFEIKSAINESKYLKITESRRKDNSVFEKDHVIVFEDEGKLFLIGFRNTINFVKG